MLFTTHLTGLGLQHDLCIRTPFSAFRDSFQRNKKPRQRRGFEAVVTI